MEISNGRMRGYGTNQRLAISLVIRDAHDPMLVSVSVTDLSNVGRDQVPTGTVMLLLPGVEGSTRLLETHPDEMTVVVATSSPSRWT
ncbi:hypothetical protein A5679_16370 [Mycobacterium scrofulaceum]|uniref:Uncharacterized protein n=1 Tax=Mycobacterium scrofulaceum TaxID=1783 RepID=A0A1A2VRB2_MYCSC|nr:hypothetical protein A5679_16370 [Mycobacterium scrofulaceum]